MEAYSIGYNAQTCMFEISDEFGRVVSKHATLAAAETWLEYLAAPGEAAE